MKMKWRHQDDITERDAMSRRSALSFADSISLTSQADRDNSDLNVLVRRFGVGPVSRPLDASRFGVFDADLDLRRALQVVSDASDSFNSLSAKVREAFNNDPLELLEALKDDQRRDELETLGIVKERPKPIKEPPITQEDPPKGKGDKNSPEKVADATK